MMSSDKEERERIRELIPLYVRDGLEENVRNEVERAIEADPELQREVAEWRSIRAGYRELTGSLPGLSPGAFDRVRHKVEEKHDSKGLLRFFSSPRLAWGFAAAQFAVIIVMSLLLVQHRSEFRTLSAQVTTNKGETRLNIVFREDATEAEIRRLLLSAGAKIVDGPSPSRCYVIAVADSKGVDKALAGFRASGIVILAEKCF
jgi:anti-sigma-K factor RskA